jgi:hypothetical protein
VGYERTRLDVAGVIDRCKRHKSWQAAEKVRVDAASWKFGVRRLDGALYFLAFRGQRIQSAVSGALQNYFFQQPILV